MDLQTQRLMMAAGGKVDPTYVDDVFSTYVYEGDGTTSHQIVNGIDLAADGGMIWGKERGNSGSHYQFDTERGLNKRLKSNSNGVEETDTFYSSVNSNGYTINKITSVNVDGNDYVSWTFRKAKGFFDVVTWSGDGNAGRQISHSLGCVPGAIFTKRLNVSENWLCYHKGMGNEKYIHLNLTNAMGDATYWNDTDPTSTYFTVNGAQQINGAGYTYVAYLFAGGEASETNSVYFDGTGDYLSLAASSDLTFDGDFTIEWWSYRGASGGMSAFGIGNLQTLGGMEMFFHSADGKVHIYTTDSSGGSNRLISTDTFAVSKWQHYALVRSGSTITLYFDGKSQGSWTESQTLGPSGNNTFTIGCSTGNSGVGALWTGKISNFRITKGQAVYTDNFNVPHEPLTQTSQNANSSNVKLLCCNGSTTTASTVTPGTITANGDPTIQGSQSIFDDTSANVFGEDSDQNIIKCGSYTTDSNEEATIDLGWEPQWVLIKRTDSSTGGDWLIYDSIRGFMNAQDTKANNGGSKSLSPNLSDAEDSSNSRLGLTSTGAFADQYGSNRSFIYVAIRRPDGYVGKPVSAGTEVFAMDTGNSSSTIPAFDSTFPVDFALYRKPAATYNWWAQNRLTGGKIFKFNANDAETDNSSETVWDSSSGWAKGSGLDSTIQSWMWKRHAGFDVVTWAGTNGNVLRRHNLGRTPEMIIFKNRDAARSWRTYHKGLNGGTNPEDYEIVINSSSGSGSNTSYMNGTAPTSTHFVSGNDGDTNGIGDNYIALLFASVEGISSVGSYSGSSSAVTLDLGFQPRLIIIRRYNTGGTGWLVFDTTRGINTGNDPYLELDETAAQVNTQDWIDLTSNGITINSGMAGDHAVNANGDSYIYYAHA